MKRNMHRQHIVCLFRMEFYLSGSGDQALPFELQAFEVPLAAAVRLFESETNALEGKLLPSLERLTAKVSHIHRYKTAVQPQNMRPACTATDSRAMSQLQTQKLWHSYNHKTSFKAADVSPDHAATDTPPNFTDLVLTSLVQSQGCVSQLQV